MSKRNELIAAVESKQQERKNIRQKMQPDIMSMAPLSIPINLYQMYIKQLETLDNDIYMLTELVKTLPDIPDAATIKKKENIIYSIELSAVRVQQIMEKKNGTTDNRYKELLDREYSAISTEIKDMKLILSLL
jgi:hypothetical protein